MVWATSRIWIMTLGCQGLWDTKPEQLEAAPGWRLMRGYQSVFGRNSKGIHTSDELASVSGQPDDTPLLRSLPMWGGYGLRLLAYRRFGESAIA